MEEDTSYLDKQNTANQLYKAYSDSGGTLAFKAWLEREKAKGIFPLNSNLNKEISETLSGIKQNEMDKTFLGFPVKTLVLMGVAVVAAYGVARLLKSKA